MCRQQYRSLSNHPTKVLSHQYLKTVLHSEWSTKVFFFIEYIFIYYLHINTTYAFSVIAGPYNCFFANASIVGCILSMFLFCVNSEYQIVIINESQASVICLLLLVLIAFQNVNTSEKIHGMYTIETSISTFHRSTFEIDKSTWVMVIKLLPNTRNYRCINRSVVIDQGKMQNAAVERGTFRSIFESKMRALFAEKS